MTKPRQRERSENGMRFSETKRRLGRRGCLRDEEWTQTTLRLPRFLLDAIDRIRKEELIDVENLHTVTRSDVVRNLLMRALYEVAMHGTSWLEGPEAEPPERTRDERDAL